MKKAIASVVTLMYSLNNVVLSDPIVTTYREFRLMAKDKNSFANDKSAYDIVLTFSDISFTNFMSNFLQLLLAGLLVYETIVVLATVFSVLTVNAQFDILAFVTAGFSSKHDEFLYVKMFLRGCGVMMLIAIILSGTFHLMGQTTLMILVSIVEAIKNALPQ